MHSRKSLPAVLAVMLAALAFAGTAANDNIVPVRFSHPDIIRYDHNGFIVHGKPVFIYSGSFHYFRCDQSEWMDRLEKIKAAGFNTIETYVPWNWTEKKKGHPDFSSLVKFLDDCQHEGLYVIIRPGPYVCAEWNIGGFPDWLEGKRVGFRTDSHADVYWSKYWYDEVLPVIRRHLITNGGNIILMQIENEYDYFTLPDSDKVAYLKSLYTTATKNGIDVPIITCWTRQTRDNSDSVFSQIMDACNFYPGWNISSTLPAIISMEKEEPESPPMITELQGGWFSSFGERSVRNVDGYGPDQISALTDYVIAHGIKALNYYMLYGGTNFGYWGSKDKTTSYDYTAPISEPGGLWAKYRAVKLIGDFIKLEGTHLVNSHPVKDGARSDTPGIETLLSSDGSSGFLYVHNENEKTTDAKVYFKPPSGPPATITVRLQPRESRLLPVDLPLPGGKILRHTNLPISAVTVYNGKPLIVAYGQPGDNASIFAGNSSCTETIKNQDHLYDCDGIYILLTSEERAGKSRVFKTSAGPISIVSDSYLMLDKGSSGKSISIELQTKPGEDAFSLLSDADVASVSLDGRAVRTSVIGTPGITTFTFNTPALKMPEIPITDVRVMADADAPAPADWKRLAVAGDTVSPLETQGDYESGYTVYSGEFTTAKEGMLKAEYYFNDWHSVIVDGKVVAGLTGSRSVNISRTRIPPGKHTLEIFYENQGWPNGGFMEQHKGLKSLSLIPEGLSEYLPRWRHAPAPSPFPAENAPEASPSYNASDWPEISVGDGDQSFIKPNEGWWFRKSIDMSEAALRGNPLLLFGAVDDNADVYVNGHLAARHVGYDSPFTVSLSRYGKTGKNVIAVYVRNFGMGGGIWKPVEYRWGIGTPIDPVLKFHHSLDGALAGWEESNANSPGWKSIQRWDAPSSADGITWYKGVFKVNPRSGWVMPWRLHLVSTGSAQIWINGRLLGRYSARGPQTNFYLPDGWLHMHGENRVTFVLRPGADGSKPPVIKQAYIAPYNKYVVQKHILKVTLK